jgi:hypothetical protein
MPAVRRTESSSPVLRQAALSGKWAVFCRALGLSCAVITGGCRDLLSADDFATSDRFVACAAAEVRTASGCVRVGVGKCGFGFDPDGNGGCEPDFKIQSCADATYLRPGLTSCSALTSSCANPGEFGSVSAAIGTVVYVSARSESAPPGAPWYPTIEDALAQQTGDLTIMLAQGTHRAHAEIRQRRVRLLGACAARTTLQSTDARPAITVHLGADGSSFEDFAVTGAGQGIAVSGAANITLIGLWLHDLGGPGVEFDDAESWSSNPDAYRQPSGSIERCLVQRATDIGVAAYGAKLDVRLTQISETLPVAPGQRAYGVVARPSPVFNLVDTSVVDARHPSELTISRAFIEQSRGAGVFVEGSSSEIDSTLIRDIQPDLSGHGVAIDVRAHTPVRVPTTLVLKQSILESAHDAVLRIWNADSASVEDTVLRDSGANMSGRCRGNGIRARYDLARDAQLGLRLSVQNTLIARTRQAGLHIEGGKAVVQDTLIRDSLAEPCRSAFGDGIAVQASATGPAGVTILRSRIENAARAGVANFDSQTSLENVLVACSGYDLAGQASGLEYAGAVCGCGANLRRCALRESLDSSLFGGDKCRAGDGTACYRGCSGSVFEPNSLLPEATVWAYDHDEVRSVLSDSSGCYELEGLPRGEPTMLSVAHDEHVSGLGMLAPLQDDSPEPHRTELVKPELLPAAIAFFDVPLDWRKIYVLLTRICASPKTSSNDTAICRGLPGITLSLTPGPSGDPIYFNGSNTPDVSLKATAGADSVFNNVVPGQHVVALHAPDGSVLTCAPDVGGLGWLTGPSQVRIVAEEGFSMFGAELNCSISPQ